MQIRKIETTVTIDVSEVDAYEAEAFPGDSRTRLFKPSRAVALPSGIVDIFGNRVKKSGELYVDEMKVSFWSGERDTEPEYVKQVRDLAASYRECADEAWGLGV